MRRSTEHTRRPGLRAMASAAAVALILTACGGGDDDGGDAAADAPTDASADDTDADTDTEADAPNEEAEAEFEGDQLTWVVAFSEGGDYDLVARLAAPYVGEELGVNVVVENQPGAGGLVALNNLYSQAGDTERIGFFSGQGLAGSVLAEAEGVQFELEEFAFLGRASAEPRILTAGADSGYDTIEAVMEGDGVTYASTGPGGSGHIDATVLYDALGINGELITGYEGASDAGLALTRGEVDIMTGPYASRIRPVEEGDHNLLLVIGNERLDDYPDVPTVLELDRSPEEQAVIEAHLASQNMGRMILGPPGLSDGHIAALEQALMNALSNPDLQAELSEVSEEILEPIDGDEARAITLDVLNAPEQYVSLLLEAFEEQ